MPAMAAARPAAATASSTSKCNSCRTCICAVPIATAAATGADVLDVKLSRGEFPAKSIADVLDLTVSEALAFFFRRPGSLPAAGAARRSRTRLFAAGATGPHAVRRRGAAPQACRTFGGQRHPRRSRPRKVRAPPGNGGARRGSLFLFDEPTTGLHFDDVAKLLRAFRRLIDAGHSLLVIEHNLDVIRAADWVIDLGPEGGEAGGRIVGVGTPAEISSLPGFAYRARADRRGQGRCRRCATRPHPPMQTRRHRAPHPRPSRFAAPGNTISRTSM